MTEERFEALLQEERLFQPSKSFNAQANVQNSEIYDLAQEDGPGFWAKQAEQITWFEPWTQVPDWQPPFAKWFVGGKLNAAYNCLDRHLEGSKRDKVAINFEGEPGDNRVLTYQELHREVSQFANVLKSLGVTKGDRVTIYLPMIPEAVIAMLACARIGAPHSVVFGGFSAEALRDRINDAEAKVLITSDGSFRRGSVVPLKTNADTALEGTKSIEHVVVVKRTGTDVEMQEGRDVWYHEAMRDASGVCPAEPMDA